MSKLQIRVIKLTDLEKNNVSEVYVLNETKGAEKGNVLFEVPKLAGGGTDTVLIPSTYIPIEITEQVSKDQLIRSSEFRKTVNSRRVVIVHPEDAQKILSTKNAQKELDRIFKDRELFRNTVMELDETSVTSTDEISKGLSDILNEDKAKSDDINPAILQLVVDLEENRDEDSAINTLRNIDELRRKDYRYVYKNVSKKHKELIKYCRDNAEKLKKRK